MTLYDEERVKLWWRTLRKGWTMTCTLRREWGYALRKRWGRDQLSAHCTIVCLLETHSARPN